MVSRLGRPFTALAAVALLAGVGTACSSSGTKSSSTTTPGGGTATTASGGSQPTGSTLKIGALSDETGPCANVPNQDQFNTISAWEKYVNDHGGVAGHPVKVTAIDTKCDPAAAAAAAQQLIADNVLALVDGTPLGSAVKTSIDAAKIPVLCGTENGNGFTCNSDANFFPSGSTVLVGLYAQAVAAKEAGAKSFGLVYCTEVAACKQAVPLIQHNVLEQGMAWVPPLAGSVSAPNFTPQCLAMQQAKAEAVFTAGVPSIKFPDDCARQGYKPIYIESTGTWQSAMLKDPNLNNATGNTTDVPWSYQGPETATFHAAEDSALATAVFPYNVSSTYAALLLFQTAMKNAGANPTTQDLYNALYAMHNETLGGYAPPLNYTQGKPTTINCFFTLKIQNGAFVSPHGATPECQSTGTAG